MPMIAALKLDDIIPSRIASGRTNGAHDRLCSRIHQPDHFHGRHCIDEHLTESHFAFRRRTITCSPVYSLTDGLCHFRVGMSQKHRSPGTDIINIIMTVHIIDMTALSPLNKPGRHADRPISPYRTAHTARHQPAGFFKYVLTFIHALSLLQPPGNIQRIVGNDHFCSGTLHRCHCLHDNPFFINPAVESRCLHHRIFAAHTVSTYRQREFI